jgi:hypothetical protein
VTFALTLAAAAAILAAAYRLQAAPPFAFAADATVPYGSGRWPNPNASRTPMTTTHDPAAELILDDQPIGDIVNTDEEPIIDPGRIDQPVKVYIDVTRAQTGDDGDHALIVQLPNDGDLNAAQAEQLRHALDLAVPWLAQTRGLQGHQS